MHNLKDLRKNLDSYVKSFKDRNVKFNIEDFKKKDALNRDLINKKEKLEQEKKILSKSKDKKNFEKSKKISQEITDLIKRQDDCQKSLDEIIFSLPNLAHSDVPIGNDEKSNKLIKKEGNIKNFSYKIKSHVELGNKNSNIDK